LAVARLETVREEFFRTTFQLMGFVAKCDGRVSEEEVAHTETCSASSASVMNSACRRSAVQGRRGADDFLLEDAVDFFQQATGGHRALNQTLLMFLVALALADHELHAASARRCSASAGCSALRRRRWRTAAHGHGPGAFPHDGGATAAPRRRWRCLRGAGWSADVSDAE
jgi:hypothetical protein